MQEIKISDFGVVVTKEGKTYIKEKNTLIELKQYDVGRCKRGSYKAVFVTNKNKKHMFYVHRLVANEYVPNPFNKKYVNHIDGNPQNNLYTNLEWVTNSENLKHAFKEFGVKYKCPKCGNEKYRKGLCKICGAEKRYKDFVKQERENKRSELLKNISMLDLDKLNEKQKDFLNMRIKGYTLKQIGEKYGITKQAVSLEMKKIFKNRSCQE